MIYIIFRKVGFLVKYTLKSKFWPLIKGSFSIPKNCFQNFQSAFHALSFHILPVHSHFLEKFLKFSTSGLFKLLESLSNWVSLLHFAYLLSFSGFIRINSLFYWLLFLVVLKFGSFRRIHLRKRSWLLYSYCLFVLFDLNFSLNRSRVLLW